MKSLVVYFSRIGENYSNGEIKYIDKGFTEIVAEKIAKKTNSDIYKVEPAEAYQLSYDGCNKRARDEAENSIRPEIKNLIKSIDEYDTIYLGFPIWYKSFPRIILTFLESFDFSGKKILPFCTNEENALAYAEIELMSILKKSKIRNGLAIKGYNAENSDEQIDNWLAQIR